MGDAEIRTIVELSDRIKPILAGHAPHIQGAVLAELLSVWLAGHLAGAATKRMREKLLREHLKTVMALVAEIERGRR